MVRPTCVMRRGWHAVTPFVLITMACGDPQGPDVESSPAAVGGFAIRTFTSDAAPQSGSAVVAAYVSGPADVAYISAPPGTHASGDIVNIVNARVQSSVDAPLVDGGFDPVPVEAISGDTLTMTVMASGEALATTAYAVPDVAGPVIVRSRPPRDQVEVPLNEVMEIVFSEPIDATSLTGQTVRLEMSNGALVPSSVSVSADALVAFVTPDAPLSGGISHTLTLGAGISDASGDPFASQVTIQFTTENAVYRLERLGTLGGSTSAAFGINDRGQVVGESIDETGDRRAFVWSAEHGMKALGIGGSASGIEESTAYGINEVGQVVGYDQGVATLWTIDSEGNEIDAIILDTERRGYARAINDVGEVVGHVNGRAQLWTLAQDGSVQARDLGTLGGAKSYAFGINAAGQVVGRSEILGGRETQYVFLWSEENGMERISEGEATGINNFGHIVGWERGDALLWNEEGSVPIRRGAEARAINDLGQVVGSDGWDSGIAWVWTSAAGLQALTGSAARASAINEGGVIVGVIIGQEAVLWRPQE